MFFILGSEKKLPGNEIMKFFSVLLPNPNIFFDFCQVLNCQQLWRTISIC